jgi:hypothetical protein
LQEQLKHRLPKVAAPSHFENNLVENARRQEKFWDDRSTGAETLKRLKYLELPTVFSEA